MIFSNGIRIFCSKCLDYGPRSTSTTRAIRAARKRGWYVGNEALCPACRTIEGRKRQPERAIYYRKSIRRPYLFPDLQPTIVEILPQFGEVAHLTWLRYKAGGCLAYEFETYLERLRRDRLIFILIYQWPRPLTEIDSIDILSFSLHDKELWLDCEPYSQRPEDWPAHKHPFEATRISEIKEMIVAMEDGIAENLNILLELRLYER